MSAPDIEKIGQDEHTKPDKDNQFPIVGIGASAGGLAPIRKLLENLPVDTGMAFVVIQHLASWQESMLPEILSRSTEMKVLQVKDGMKVEGNQVYVITPGTTITLDNSILKVAPKGVALKPINDFLISLASERKALAIGIVLSGTGNDGTEGLKAIKAEGGITFVQDPETAQYADMPRNAIVAETAYFVLSPEDMVKDLVRIAKNPQLARVETESAELAKGETYQKKILMMLKTAFGVDFTHYKETTIKRRLTRRMVISKIENDKEYIAFLRAHPNELSALFDDLLIGVTSFFREPKTFEALREKVFPELIRNRPPIEPIRVWVPGCSTGEEVYSLAIAVEEFLEEKTILDLRVQIFGTDANERSVEKARQGVYPKTIEDNVSESRLKRFFTRQNGDYQITKNIRDKCIFARQDITSDPPFSNLDLILCRNVLIYFDALLQERLFPIFHYGLKDNRFLVIGESESIGKFSYLFEPVTSKGLIFRKKRAQPQALLRPETLRPYSSAKKASKQIEPNSMVLLRDEVDRLLITEYVPASLLVNNNLDILLFRGQVNPYLTHEPGPASLNIAKMVRKELRTEVQTVIYLARKEGYTLNETVRFKHEGQQKAVMIQVKPLKMVDYEEPFFLVTFEEENPPRHRYQEAESKTSIVEKETVEETRVRELREDLESTKQSLQTIIEAQEATNEELRSTMEEAQSSNEELQSTNEELETAKEELQSSNEELQTLNEELNNRNQTLGRLNDDLANLQINIDTTVVIVDNELKIRRFTNSALQLLKILPSDVGRPITDLHLGIQIEDIENILCDVITKLFVFRKEVAGGQNSWYELKVRPYITVEKKIGGAVLSFIDITETKKIDQALKLGEEEYRSLFSNMMDGFAYCQMVFSKSGKPSDFVYLKINDAFERITGLKREQVIGKKVTVAIPGIEKANPELFEIYGRVASTGQKEKFEIFLKPLSLWLSISVYSPRKGYFAAVFEDITERKKAEKEEEITNEYLHIANKTMGTLELVKETTNFLQEQSGCEAVGIRLKDGDDYPYYETRGFPPEHVLLENKLCLEDKAGFIIRDSKGDPILECMCGNVICGRFDPSKEYFTEKGSFWTNSTTAFLSSISEADRQTHTRNRCNSEGYESLALIPLSVGTNRLGLLQINDRRKDMFSPEAIKLWERIAENVALTLSKTIAEDKLEKYKQNLEKLVEERTKQLQDSERLAAIGATAGMVGHDIRNPLQAITSDIYLVKTELASTPESNEKKCALESLKEVEKSVEYINKIVADLQNFARPLNPNVETVDLKFIIDEIIAKNGLPENIKVSVIMEPAANTVVADSTFINRIMYNLVTNSVQAMPTGGKLTISAYRDKKTSDAIITVEDTGVGITKEAKGKLFTPMFTTKAKGQGFGLAVIKRMTEALGGTVTLESEVGKGTKFIVRLPPPKKTKR